MRYNGVLTFKNTYKVDGLSIIILGDVVCELLNTIVNGSRRNHQATKGVLIVGRDVEMFQRHGCQIAHKERFSSETILSIYCTIELAHDQIHV